MNHAIGIAHLLEMGGKLPGDFAQLFGGIVDGADQVAPMAERLIADLAGDGDEQLCFEPKCRYKIGSVTPADLAMVSGGGCVVAVLGKLLGCDMNELFATLRSFEPGHGQGVSKPPTDCNTAIPPPCAEKKNRRPAGEDGPPTSRQRLLENIGESLQPAAAQQRHAADAEQTQRDGFRHGGYVTGNLRGRHRRR